VVAGWTISVARKATKLDGGTYAGMRWFADEQEVPLISKLVNKVNDCESAFR